MLDTLLSYLLIYQYTLLFFVVFFASFGFPIPASALIMAVGAFAVDGYFDLSTSFFVVFVWVLAGDFLGYMLARIFGKGLFIRLWMGSIFETKQFHTFEPFFQNHAFFSIFFSRFLLTIIGPAINILSGIAHIPLFRFLIADISGEILYVLLYGGIGYVFWNEWEYMLSILQNLSAFLFSCFAFFFLLVFFWKLQKKEL
mgnify:FL=1